MKCKLYTIEVVADDDTIAYTVVCEDNTMHRVVNSCHYLTN